MAASFRPMQFRSPRKIGVDFEEVVEPEARKEADLLEPKRVGEEMIPLASRETLGPGEFLELHGHIAGWMTEEMEILDGVNEGQEWWLPVVREGVREKNELEVKLRQMKVEETDRLEEVCGGYKDGRYAGGSVRTTRMGSSGEEGVHRDDGGAQGGKTGEEEGDR